MSFTRRNSRAYYVRTEKSQGVGVIGSKRGRRAKVFVTGDLFIDNVVVGLKLGAVNRIPRGAQVPGGSAFNAALAFKREGFDPVVFGTVGRDPAGDVIVRELRKHGIDQFITRSNGRPTAQCNILHFRDGDELRTIYYEIENANTYDAAILRDAIKAANLGPRDYLFSPLYIVEQMRDQLDGCRHFMAELAATQARLIVDLVPHRLYEFCDAAMLRELIVGDPWLVVGSLETFSGLMGRARDGVKSVPTRRDCENIAREFKAEHFTCRYGVGNIDNEIFFDANVGAGADDIIVHNTGYAALSPDETRGFGDLLTARAVRTLAGLDEISPAFNGRESG
jgi:pfkB family carbohydrate kinase